MPEITSCYFPFCAEQQFLPGARNRAFTTQYVAGLETVKSLQMESQLKARSLGSAMCNTSIAVIAVREFCGKDVSNPTWCRPRLTSSPARYIELNPVRANMVSDPAQYRWSSHRPNGLGQMDERIAPHPQYLALGEDAALRQAAYRGLLRSELDEEALADIRLALAQGQPLGSERFSEIMCAAVGVRRAQRKPGRPVVKKDQDARVEDQVDFGF